MTRINRIAPCLWFDDQAETAARFYVSVFEDSRIVRLAHYGKAGHEIHGRPPGSVMTVAFELAGQAFTALNGGPLFTFSEAISLQVTCDTQAEVDYYWERLGNGGDEAAQRCGWLKDCYGLSWQIVPAELPDMLSDPEDPRSQRTMESMLQMKKLDIAALRTAYAG